jgi:hypothetical protein
VGKILIERLLAPYRGLDPRVFWVMLCNLLFLGARLAVLTFLSIYVVRNQGFARPIRGRCVPGREHRPRRRRSDRWIDLRPRVPLLVASALGAAILVPAFLAFRDPSALFV